MKILFVNAEGTGIPPLGLMSLSAMLKNSGYTDVEVIDLNHVTDYERRTKSYLMKQLKKKPHIVGVSCATPSWKKALEICELSRKYCKVLMLGGPHASLFKEQVMKKCSLLDIVVVGEADNTIVDIARRIECKNDIEGVPGTIYRKKRKIVINPPNPPIRDLDSLPWPDRDCVNLESYHAPLSIITSRGCPYDCEFCFKSVTGRIWRSRSPKNVADEIEYLLKRYPAIAEKSGRKISISDDIFNLDINRAKKICDEIIKRKLDINIHAVNGFHVKTVDYELFEKAKKAGFKEIWFGVDSGSEKILPHLGKGITLDNVRTAVSLAKQAGIERVGAHFIIGLTNETPETARETISFAKSLNLDIAGFNHANILPGTRLWDWVQLHGRHLYDCGDMDFSMYRHLAGYPIFETDEFDKEERKKVYDEACSFVNSLLLKSMLRPENIRRFILRKDVYKDIGWAMKRLYHLFFEKREFSNLMIKPSNSKKKMTLKNNRVRKNADV